MSRLIALLSLSSLCLTSIAAAAPSGPHRIAVLPFTTMTQGTPVVELQMGNHTAGRFMLSTQTNGFFVSDKLAAQLKLKVESATSGGHSYQVVIIPHLEFGSPDNHADNIPMVVTDLAGAISPGDKPIDGVLGANFFAANAIAIDYRKGLITLWNQGNVSDAELKTAGYDHASTDEIKPSAPGSYLYTVPVVLKNGDRSKKIDLILNTMSPYNVMPGSAANELGVTPSHPWDHPDLNAASIGSMSLGTATTTSSFFVISSDPPELGLDTISRYRTLIDIPAGKLYLSPFVSVSPAPAQSAGLEVPFEFGPSTQHKIIVRASVNGAAPRSFVLDTGTQMALLLDRTAAREMGIAEMDKNSGKMNGVEPTSEGAVSSIVLQGNTPADNLTVSMSAAQIANLKPQQQMTGFVSAGVIGAGILNNTAVRFNFVSHIATFYPLPLVAPISSKAVSLPLLPTLRRDAYYVNVDFGRHTPTALLIDTGDGYMTVPKSALPAEISKSDGPCMSFMAGVLMIGQEFKLPRVGFGALSATNISAMVMPIDRIPYPTPGNLGYEALSQFVVTLDIPHNRLILEPSSNPQSSDDPTGWIGILLAGSGGSTMKITGVEPGSPADLAGIKESDILVSVDGKSVASLGYTVLTDLLAGSAGTTAVVEVRDVGGTLQTFRVPRIKQPDGANSPLAGIYAIQFAGKPIIVDSVTAGSVAAKAGIMPGDAITAIDGHPIAAIAAGYLFNVHHTYIDLTIRKQNKGTPVVVHLVSPADGKPA